MRKTPILLTAIFAFVVLSLVPAHATTIKRTIAVPTAARGTVDSSGGTCTPDQPDCQKLVETSQQRCLWLANPNLAQDNSGGKLGYTVEGLTGGGAFSLGASPAGSADFDIVFFQTWGNCQNAPEPVTTGAFAHFGNGAETGTIPAATTRAIIVLWGSANASFTFTY